LLNCVWYWPSAWNEAAAPPGFDLDRINRITRRRIVADSWQNSNRIHFDSYQICLKQSHLTRMRSALTDSTELKIFFLAAQEISWKT
jgi:hypothetical protein